MCEGHNQIKIVFIDFGNIELKSFKEFFPIEKSFVELPAQAIACSLSQVDQTNWTLFFLYHCWNIFVGISAIAKWKWKYLVRWNNWNLQTWSYESDCRNSFRTSRWRTNSMVERERIFRNRHSTVFFNFNRPLHFVRILINNQVKDLFSSERENKSFVFFFFSL